MKKENNYIRKSREHISYKFKGFQYYFKLILRILSSPIKYFYLNLFKKNKKFSVNGKFYFPLYSWKRHAFENERSIEIPYFLSNINYKKEILEIGNVISNFCKFKHDVVDKYEKSPCVINEDILNFNPNKRYDQIISISTFEHIGYDEDIEDPMKILEVIKKCKRLLKDGGGYGL